MGIGLDEQGLREMDEANRLADPTMCSLIESSLRLSEEITVWTDEGKTYFEPSSSLQAVQIAVGEDDDTIYFKISPHKTKLQRLTSLLLHGPAFNTAEVIITPEGVGYSREMDMEKIQQKEGISELKVEALVADFIVSDFDHKVENDKPKKNIAYEDGKYYLFDFNHAFSRTLVDLNKNEDKGLKVLTDQFHLFFPDNNLEVKKHALELCKEKTAWLDKIYDVNGGGKALIAAMCKKAGYGDDLSELYYQWNEDGIHKLYQYMRKRIDMLKIFCQRMEEYLIQLERIMEITSRVKNKLRGLKI